MFTRTDAYDLLFAVALGYVVYIAATLKEMSKRLERIVKLLSDSSKQN